MIVVFLKLFFIFQTPYLNFNIKKTKNKLIYKNIAKKSIYFLFWLSYNISGF